MSCSAAVDSAAPSPAVDTATSVEAVGPPAGVASVPDTDALALLATLPVKGRAPRTGYSRDLFGQAWTDDVRVAGGHNGCDTRNDVLRRDLTDATTKAGTAGCKVVSGTLFDEYTGETGSFESGPDTSPLAQVDHLVSLSNAWQTGAQQLDEATRTDLANDPRNLQAVGGAVNQQKGDGDAATWLPPRRAYRCTYVARQVEVKAAYRLWVTPAERDAIARVLSGCGGADPAPAPATPAAPADPGAVRYPTCAAARAAGAAPLHAGSPGYRPDLDGDGDGVACETAPR
ncbi:GmrSD restriction endonuclease domain-containing protein [Rhodococcus olei]|uniref:GmrSD restriction endonuclease domain-containing protein n=1 Tax=Rhodococcus olei TaxID=2161675 RepID=UPI0031E7807E